MNQKKKEWAFEQIQLLQQIKKAHKQKKWKLISKNLAKKGYKRTEHQCRHKWVNCLNPQINHGPWTQQQLKILYTQYQKNYSQWSIIQKSLPNRTQIRIKNHFYGVLRNIMRFILKYFKKITGKQSEISNKINPNSLQLIYRGQLQFSFIENHIKNAIFNMEFHFEKQKLIKLIQKNQQLYQKLNDKLLEQTLKLNISQQGSNILFNQSQLSEQNLSQMIDCDKVQLPMINIINHSQDRLSYQQEIQPPRIIQNSDEQNKIAINQQYPNYNIFYNSRIFMYPFPSQQNTQPLYFFNSQNVIVNFFNKQTL